MQRLPSSGPRSKRIAQRWRSSDEPGANLGVQLTLSHKPREPRDPTALANWCERIGTGVRDARGLATQQTGLDTGHHAARMRLFMTGEGHRTALDIEPTPWFRMTETQITRPLADFLNEGGTRRILAFLRALPCAGVALPDALESGRARAEVPAAGGRVDLLVTGRARRRTYGAAVEVKIDHTLHNPLGSYANVARDEGLVIAGKSPGTATGALVVLARHASAATLKRLSANRGWTFAHWSGFLRRFERELACAPDDDDFRAFRRMVWDRFI